MAHLLFEIRVGRLNRRAVIRYLRAAAQDAGVEFSYDEDKGWLDSQYLCKAIGDDDAVLRFKEDFVEWATTVIDK